MEGLRTLQQLLRQLQRVPYLASKNLYRVAQHFLSLTPEQLDLFCRALKEAQVNLVRCDRCCAWRERTSGCLFCDAPGRDHGIICVVETWYDLTAIERSGAYNGEYHVLGGALSPLDGIGPEDLSVQQLVARLDGAGTQDAGKRREIILAMNQTPEGEATAAFVARALRGMEVAITCLARGMPVGSTLEFMDRLTLNKALSERRNF
ncbi:MAG: recombination mediator RecR [Candidatus Dependentiae bacterium]|nr:recombination mediator RecR [Candidatus Dependentiae bacterium]